MKELVEAIAKALVDHPEQVQVNAVEGEQVTVLELRVASRRFGKSDWTAGPHREIDPHAAGRRRNEVEESVLRWKSSNNLTSGHARIREHHCGAHPAPTRTGAAKWPPKSSPIFPNGSRLCKVGNLWDGRAEPRHSAVRGCWLSHSRGGQAIFHFEGSDSISDAEKLVGLEVQIPFADRMQLALGQLLHHGSHWVRSAREGWRRDRAGHGRAVHRRGGVAGTPILVIDSTQGELLIPLAQDICVNVDTGARRIEVVLPEGLRELNRD